MSSKIYQFVATSTTYMHEYFGAKQWRWWWDICCCLEEPSCLGDYVYPVARTNKFEERYHLRYIHLFVNSNTNTNKQTNNLYSNHNPPLWRMRFVLYTCFLNFSFFFLLCFDCKRNGNENACGRGSREPRKKAGEGRKTRKAKGREGKAICTASRNRKAKVN